VHGVIESFLCPKQLEITMKIGTSFCNDIGHPKGNCCALKNTNLFIKVTKNFFMSLQNPSEQANKIWCCLWWGCCNINQKLFGSHINSRNIAKWSWCKFPHQEFDDSQITPMTLKIGTQNLSDFNEFHPWVQENIQVLRTTILKWCKWQR
jgi:hypothetical protein